MSDTTKMLRAVINGQSAMKSGLVTEIKKVDQKVDKLGKKLDEGFKQVDDNFKKVNKRIDRLGIQLAELEDDAPTNEEFDKLGKRVTNLEHQYASS